MTTSQEITNLTQGDSDEPCSLSEGERSYMTHIQRWGSEGYPVRKLGSRWIHERMYGVGGCPSPFKTKREAVAHVELYISILHDKAAGRKPGTGETCNAVSKETLSVTPVALAGALPLRDGGFRSAVFVGRRVVFVGLVVWRNRNPAAYKALELKGLYMGEALEEGVQV